MLTIRICLLIPHNPHSKTKLEMFLSMTLTPESNQTSDSKNKLDVKAKYNISLVLNKWSFKGSRKVKPFLRQVKKLKYLIWQFYLICIELGCTQLLIVFYKFISPSTKRKYSVQSCAMRISHLNENKKAENVEWFINSDHYILSQKENIKKNSSFKFFKAAN